ncbi:uncharacterized protein LOC122352797 [Puntigrus tetrazona]|uniref:uncharacterized protein LOC122352797 n=1 Tax=Puntigrus tetrazona TaxID=1606681 RepID=UPI001C89FF23|nr:uncharacterized protein LOC122352797 [Puntigrus tetrazona]
MLSSVKLYAMAEVMRRFGRGAYKLLKPRKPPLLDKNGKPVTTEAYVAALINSPQLCEIRNDRVEAAKRPADLETPEGTVNTLFTCACGDVDSVKVPPDLHFGSVSNVPWTDLHGSKSKECPVHVSSWRSSCLGTLGNLPLLSSQLRKSIYKKTLRGFPNDYLWQFVCLTRAYSGTQDKGSPLYKSKSAYYDILDVSPSATYTQIKTAYYKQSFIFHPDKNAGSEEAVFRFSQISEAYSVLGNKALRRKYDRGILSQADLQGTSKEGPASGQQSRTRHVPSVGEAQQKIYNFDAFIKSHYREQLKREQESREHRKDFIRKEKELPESRMKEFAIGLMMVLSILIFLNI